MRSYGQKMNEEYFFDTYAIVEIIKGSISYREFRHSRIVITIFNLVELHYKILRDFNRQLANEILDKYADYVINIDKETIKKANEFKLLYRKKRISAPDAIGYAMAKNLGIKFLTGDKQFEKLENVEFVK